MFRTYVFFAGFFVTTITATWPQESSVDLPRLAEIRLLENAATGELARAQRVGGTNAVRSQLPPLLTSEDIEVADVLLSPQGELSVSAAFTEAGSEKLERATRANLGKYLAVIVQGKVISASKIMSPISGSVIISGHFSPDEAHRIADALAGEPATQESSSGLAMSEWTDLFNGHDLSGWVNVNTDPDTWQVQDGMLICRGLPIGVMRTEKQYENFLLHIEWKHMEPGGNSGVFVWSEGHVPEGRRLPKGMEVQMLERSWINLHPKADGSPNEIGYISGELFGAGGLQATPNYPRGRRSMSRELRCNPAGQWNAYDLVCVDGTVNLSINGKFVNSIRESDRRKGHLCLESEGAEIHFRNIRIMELLPAPKRVGDPPR